MRPPERALGLAAFAAAVFSGRPAAADGTKALERLSFDACARRAVERHPNVATAMSEAARADALVRQARAASFPTLYGNGVYTRLDGDRVLGDRVIAGANQLSANLALSVPLLNPQGWAAWSRAGDQASVRHGLAQRRRGVAETALFLTQVGDVHQQAGAIFLQFGRTCCEHVPSLLEAAIGRREATLFEFV